MTGVVFVQVVPPRTKFSFSIYLSEILGVCRGCLRFVDLEKAYEQVLKISSGKCCKSMVLMGNLLIAITLHYCQPEVCVRINGKQSKLFHVGFGLRQKCFLSSLLFIVCMNLMDKFSRTDGCVTIGRCNIRRLLFADDLVLLV